MPDDAKVDRIKDDYCVVVHAQGGRSVDPVTLPTGSSQPGKHLLGVLATLTRDYRVQVRELAAHEALRALRGAAKEA